MWPNLWPDLWLEGPNLRLLRLDLRPERPNLRPDRLDLRPDRLLGGTDKRTNKQTNKRKSPCVLQDFVPFGAAAQKGKLVIEQAYAVGPTVRRTKRRVVSQRFKLSLKK